MATQQSFVEYVVEQSGLGRRLSFRKMFGEYGLYLDGTVIAFACDNSLFVKPAAETARLTAELPQRPPYPGAKDYPVADQLLDEPDELRALLLATAAVMPLPKPKAAPKLKVKAAPKAEAVPKAKGAPKAEAVSKASAASKAKAAANAKKTTKVKAVPKANAASKVKAKAVPKAKATPKEKAAPKTNSPAGKRAAK